MAWNDANIDHGRRWLVPIERTACFGSVMTSCIEALSSVENSDLMFV